VGRFFFSSCETRSGISFGKGENLKKRKRRGKKRRTHEKSAGKSGGKKGVATAAQKGGGLKRSRRVRREKGVGNISAEDMFHLGGENAAEQKTSGGKSGTLNILGDKGA